MVLVVRRFIVGSVFFISLFFFKFKLIISNFKIVILFIDIFVATQFLTHVLINFQKNPKIAKKH
jgi:hypothetical protein